MKVSTLKLAWKYVTGGFGAVADYLLDILNTALRKIDPSDRDRIQAALNVARKVLASLVAFAWLCPVKWQTAYTVTVRAVECVVAALADLELTPAELTDVRDAFNAAVLAWKSGDDDTCTDCVEE